MFKNKYKSIIFVSFLLASFCSLFSLLPVASAQQTLKLTYEFPCSTIGGGTCPTSEETASSPAAYIARIYQFALALAGILAFGMIIFGAIQYVVSAGNSGQQEDARDRIWQALLGVALLLGAYLILYTIDPKLVNLTDPDITLLHLLPATSDSTAASNNKPGSWVPANSSNPNGSYFCPDGSVTNPNNCAGNAPAASGYNCCL